MILKASAPDSIFARDRGQPRDHAPQISGSRHQGWHFSCLRSSGAPHEFLLMSIHSTIYSAHSISKRPSLESRQLPPSMMYSVPVIGPVRGELNKAASLAFTSNLQRNSDI
jgi:hypothetical protein